MRIKYCLFAWFIITTATASAQDTYTNPVYPFDFADPTVIRGHDGAFYAYATNSGSSPAFRNIQNPATTPQAAPMIKLENQKP